ncbi:MAG: phytanoyl-CoA dioxygenase family protein [Candidatus Sericytochromatia bacterium]|nr:phytanoyl-CoA dioxygenase family protein [Candidatus Sericytochromatia bacterium]
MTAAYNAAGYAVLRGFLPPADVQRIRTQAMGTFALGMGRTVAEACRIADEPDFESALFAFFAEDPDRFIACARQAQQCDALHQLATDSRILAMVHALQLEWPIMSSRPQLYFHHPRLAQREEYWRLGQHQDWRTGQGSLDAVTVWLPLVDCDRSLGALEVIPGSHRRGLLDTEAFSYFGKIATAIDDSRFKSMAMEAGDVLVFSAFLVHRSGTNTSDAIRWSCQFRFNNLAEPTFQARSFPNPFTYQPQAALVTADFPTPAQVAAVFDQPSLVAPPDDR